MPYQKVIVNINPEGLGQINHELYNFQMYQNLNKQGIYVGRNQFLIKLKFILKIKILQI